MKHQYEFFEVYKVFRSLVKTQPYVVIKCFRYDLDEKYTSKKFIELLASNGTI